MQVHLLHIRTMNLQVRVPDIHPYSPEVEYPLRMFSEPGSILSEVDTFFNPFPEIIIVYGTDTIMPCIFYTRKIRMTYYWWIPFTCVISK